MNTLMEASDASDIAPYPVQLVAVPVSVIFGLLLYSTLNAPDFINYDCAFYLLGSKLLLEGKQPMQNFVDLLPPIILYFALPPWWFSKLMSIPIVTVWQGFVLASIYMSGFASVAVLHQATPSIGKLGDDIRRAWLAIGPLVTAFFLFQLTLGFHFGQREHLFILSYFPMFLLRWLRWHGSFTSKRKLVAACLGVACGAITYVKPQFLIIPTLVELALFLSSGHRQQWLNNIRAVELKTWAITLGCCFLASFAIPNIHEYYTRWVPFLSNGYAAYNAPSIMRLLMFNNPDGYLLGSVAIALTVLLLCLILFRRSSLLPPLLAWTFGGLIIFVLQGRGWSYQSIPCVAGFLLLAATLMQMLNYTLLNFLATKLKIASSITSKSHRFAIIMFLGWSIALIPMSPLLVKNSMVTGKTFASLNDLIDRETRRNDPVVILHTMLPYAHQLQLKKELTPATRYVWCFPLRMTYYLKSKTETREAATAQEEKVVGEIVNDILGGKPKLVVIEAWATQPDGWTLARALEKHQFSQIALADYEPRGLVNGCAIWKRRNP